MPRAQRRHRLSGAHVRPAARVSALRNRTNDDLPRQSRRNSRTNHRLDQRGFLHRERNQHLHSQRRRHGHFDRRRNCGCRRQRPLLLSRGERRRFRHFQRRAARHEAIPRGKRLTAASLAFHFAPVKQRHDD